MKVYRDITRGEILRKAYKIEESRTIEATKKNFVAELEKQISPIKKLISDMRRIISFSGEQICGISAFISARRGMKFTVAVPEGPNPLEVTEICVLQEIKVMPIAKNE